MPNPSLRELEKEGDLIRRSQILKSIVKSDSTPYEEMEYFLQTQIRSAEKKAWRRFCQKILAYLYQQEDKKLATPGGRVKFKGRLSISDRAIPSPFGVPLKLIFYLGLACWIVFLFRTLDQNQGFHSEKDSTMMAGAKLQDFETSEQSILDSSPGMHVVTRLQTLKTKARDPLSDSIRPGALHSRSSKTLPRSKQASPRLRNQRRKWVDITRILRKAREGHGESQAIMGGLYIQGKQVEKNYHKAFQWYLRASVQGHSQAQNDLAALYYKGHGVPRDHREATKWWKLSAEKNYAVAQNNLGYLYEQGQGVKKDNAIAAKWYLRAAEQGYHKAQNNLAVMYDQGRGVPELPEAAVQWWLRAAEQDYSKAQNNLGVMYYQGRGVEKDYSEALRWWNLSARHGYARAQNNLGIMYEEGTGVEKDVVMAYAWLSLAFINGYNQAGEWRSELELRMTPTQQAMAQELIYGSIDSIPAPVTDY